MQAPIWVTFFPKFPSAGYNHCVIHDPSPHGDVNLVLCRLSAALEDVLGEQMVGFYLHGSLAAGDFNPASSDIDFLVVTESELPADMLVALERMHGQLHSGGSKWARKMEGSYIPRAALRRYDPANAVHPVLRVDGSFGVEGHGPDWILQRHVIREHGIALRGPDLKGLIDPVPAEDLRRSSLGILREWWQPMLEDTSRLASREYQAYAALTMCRILYTLEHGEVVSKPAAARWFVEGAGASWRGLVEQALAWPGGAQPDRLAETCALIRYTLKRSDFYGRDGSLRSE